MVVWRPFDAVVVYEQKRYIQNLTKAPNNQFCLYASLLRTRLQAMLERPGPSPMRFGNRIHHDCQCGSVNVSASEGNHTHSCELWAPRDPRSQGQRPTRSGYVSHPFS